MELLTALIHEESIDLIAAAIHADSFSFVLDLVAQSLLFIFREEVRNFTGVQKVVDVFEESLVDDLVVREQELLLVIVDQNTLFEQLFDAFLEVANLVVLLDFDCVRLHVTINKGCKLGHGFSARTADTYQQGVTSRLL